MNETKDLLLLLTSSEGTSGLDSMSLFSGVSRSSSDGDGGFVLSASSNKVVIRSNSKIPTSQFIILLTLSHGNYK